MRALVTGATGFVGKRLISRLNRPVVLSRDAARADKVLQKYPIEAFEWNSMRGPAPAAAFEGIDSVIHLAGESLADGRWSDAKKQRIRDSRLIGTRNLIETLASLDNKPSVLISASAVGYYGPSGDEVLDESSPPGDDFLADVCRQWEEAALPAAEFGIRVVTPRIGIVLGRNGGALQKMLLPFKMGVGGRLGSGKQWMPWIHLDDLVALMLYAITHEEIQGAINATSPEPVINAEFTKMLGKVLRRPTIIPMPAFALKAALGEFSEVLLGSQRVIPRKAEESGFQYGYPQLEGALRSSV